MLPHGVMHENTPHTGGEQVLCGLVPNALSTDSGLATYYTHAGTPWSTSFPPPPTKSLIEERTTPSAGEKSISMGGTDPWISANPINVGTEPAGHGTGAAFDELSDARTKAKHE